MIRTALVFCIACGHPAHPPGHGSAPPPADAAVQTSPGLDQDLPKLAARAVQLYTDVAAAFAAAGENCAAATAKLEELGKTYADFTAASAKVLHDGRAMQLKIALREHEDEFEKQAKSIMASRTLAHCSEDPKFDRAFDFVSAPP